ncbi:mitochondrial enolase superfamily member 1 [Grus japonensis]|uniref:Mitochondrial enolase superfamily member 1 n=1 Tax=Grus japonensis TaxID=30415 RepID=A0ABC9YIM6_GRUJA
MDHRDLLGLEMDWKKANITPIFEKGKEDLGNYSLDSLTSIRKKGDGAPNSGKYFQAYEGQKSEAFDTVFHAILTNQPMKPRLEEWTVRLTENCLNC